ncbi:hypothetical protein [Microvirga ossetica]|uniref:hypothetical protein n=1 Tax=Microvirga ossetica TaxID=1882682 RepID=UPI001300033B|nr:hypothetical protein [Microvirga ossetica]
MDVTNLKRNGRLAIVDKIAADIQIIYEVVDRPLAEKVATGDWRLKKQGLIEGHGELFIQELPNIPAGEQPPERGRGRSPGGGMATDHEVAAAIDLLSRSPALFLKGPQQGASPDHS